MFQNYLKAALRNLLRQKTYTFINVFGLAVGLACCLLILNFVLHELRFDAYHEKKDRIYRFVADLEVRGGIIKPAMTAAPETPALLLEFPEIEAAVRLFKPFFLSTPVLSYGEKHFSEPDLLYADPEVFEVFTLPFVAGDPMTALRDPNSVVLTSTSARKYFGDEDPLGRVVVMDDTLSLRVTGVMVDLPANTHLKFDMLTSMSTIAALHPILMEAWNSPLFHTYLLLRAGHSAEALQSKFGVFAMKYLGEQYFPRMYGLEALTRIHLHSQRYAALKPGGNINYVYIFSAVAGLVLLIACINFMNLATARSASRAREVGLRKTLGAHRTQLIRQFLGESILMASCGLAVALVAIDWLQPFFSSIVGREIPLTLLSSAVMPLALLGGTLLVGILAGGYPAFYLSAFRPAEVFRSNLRGGAAGSRFRKALVIFQFSVSTTLIVCTLVVRSQLEFFQSKDLGFNKEQVVVLPIGIHPAGEQIEVIKAEVLQNPQIISVTASFGVPGRGIVGMDYWLENTNDDKLTNAISLLVDDDFVSTYGIEVTQGRSFSQEHPGDRERAFVINESAVRQFGWNEPIGKRIKWMQPGPNGYEAVKDGAVIGVVRDFHHAPLQTAIQPMIMQMWADWQTFNSVSIRIRPQNVSATLEFVEKTRQKFAPSRPFEYFFLDENFAALYQSEQRLGRTFLYFAIVAIAVAGLGLFGLASYMTEQRTKEIGIRKVLGASVTGIIGLLSKEFVLLIVIANLVSWPIAYFAMREWLQNFAYRIDQSVVYFVVTGLAVLGVALLTVSYEAIKAALTNPVEALRE